MASIIQIASESLLVGTGLGVALYIGRQIGNVATHAARASEYLGEISDQLCEGLHQFEVHGIGAAEVVAPCDPEQGCELCDLEALIRTVAALPQGVAGGVEVDGRAPAVVTESVAARGVGQFLASGNPGVERAVLPYEAWNERPRADVEVVADGILGAGGEPEGEWLDSESVEVDVSEHSGESTPNDVR